jgi:hypothetical protein
LAHGHDYELPDGTHVKVKQRYQQDFKSKRMLVTEQEFLHMNKEKEIERHAAILQILNQQLTVGNDLFQV